MHGSACGPEEPSTVLYPWIHCMYIPGPGLGIMTSLLIFRILNKFAYSTSCSAQRLDIQHPESLTQVKEAESRKP